MTDFAGWVGGQHTYQEMKRQLQLLAKTFTQSHTQSVYLPVGAMVAPTQGRVKILQNGTAAIAILGNIYWHHKRTGHYCLSAEEVLEAYLHQGAQCLNTFRGEFALAIILAEHDEVFLACDHFNTHPIYFTDQNDHFVFSSRLASVCNHMAVKTEVNNQAIYDYFCQHFIASPDTVYQSIQCVAPGHYILHRKGQTLSIPYWQPAAFTRKSYSFNRSKSQLKSLLNRSIQKYEHQYAGAFLSGGLDSSTVAGFLSEQNSYQVPAFTIGFDHDQYDESAYAKLVAKHFNLQLHHRVLNAKDVLQALPDIFKQMNQPFANASLIGAYFAAKMAREQGVDLLLAGDGGDELFGGNTRYQTHYWYDKYRKIPKLFKWLCIEATLKPFSVDSPISLIRKAKKFTTLAMMPLIQREFDSKLIDTIGSDTIFQTEFLESINTQHPLLAEQASYQKAQGKTWLGKLLCHDFKWILADNDIQKVRMACAMNQVEVHFPMLDDLLVKFALKLPDHYKVGKRGLRSFYKKALSDWLPSALMTKAKHGFGVPVGLWILQDESFRAFAFDTLAQLKNRDYIRPEFIDTLQNKLLPQHPGYYGVLVWDLVTLEQWLQKHPLNQTKFEATAISEALATTS